LTFSKKNKNKLAIREEKFVQYEVIVAGNKSYQGILTPAQQQTDILVAASL